MDPSGEPYVCGQLVPAQSTISCIIEQHVRELTTFVFSINEYMTPKEFKTEVIQVNYVGTLPKIILIYIFSTMLT